MKTYQMIALTGATLSSSTAPGPKHAHLVHSPGKVHRSTDGYYAFLPPDSPESEVDKVTQIMINCAVTDTIKQLKTLSDRLEALKELRTQPKP